MNDNPYAPPTAPVSDPAHASGASSDAQHRGWALTSFLLFVGVTSLLTIALYAGLFGLALTAGLPEWMVRTFLIVAIAALTFLVLPITLSQGYKSTALSPLGVALLVYLIRRQWPYMRWSLLPPERLRRDLRP
jgi:hypothetical protein